MSDNDCRHSSDPYIGPLPNNFDVFWWELKTSNKTVINSKSQWTKLSTKFPFGGVVVSLTDGQVPPDEVVYPLFHNSMIIDEGSWVRMNATLRQHYLSSLSGGNAALAVKLGTLTYSVPVLGIRGQSG